MALGHGMQVSRREPGVPNWYPSGHSPGLPPLIRCDHPGGRIPGRPPASRQDAAVRRTSQGRGLCVRECTDLPRFTQSSSSLPDTSSPGRILAASPVSGRTTRFQRIEEPCAVCAGAQPCWLLRNRRITRVRVVAADHLLRSRPSTGMREVTGSSAVPTTSRSRGASTMSQHLPSRLRLVKCHDRATGDTLGQLRLG